MAFRDRAPRDREFARDQPRSIVRGPPRDAPTVVNVDREKVCPFLLRVFLQKGAHHRVEDFATRGKEPVDSEIQIYTWRDATLREITRLIQDVNEDARQRGARLSFSIVYPDQYGKNVMRPVGTVHAQRGGADDRRTLGGLDFVTGDYLDVAILTADARS